MHEGIGFQHLIPSAAGLIGEARDHFQPEILQRSRVARIKVTFKVGNLIQGPSI